MAENQQAVETLTPSTPNVAPKKKMPKSQIATIVMFACIIFFVVMFIVLYSVGGGIKDEWNAAKIVLKEYELFGPAEMVPEAQAKVDGLVASYRVCSIGSYICSILALVSLGVGLAKTDKYKTQEEEAAEAM